ncbi:hypothetical protein [Haloarcula nitratireducens]|uniref:Uncharacterized protein n=1 Tax=Haloarcula nitratireducens TaxID=2487749 RepID=A0AAW4PHQ9_9EURY|nr:hypothetical protein [Halomicroarcula nitratireducens]MBX0297519.1 hypothetical protein [Halomicroarcula nitratireducens]
MTATQRPAVGDVVALTELEHAPRLLVTSVDENEETVTGVLLADLADKTLQRLAASVDDRSHREELVTALRRTTALARFCVPCPECRQVEQLVEHTRQEEAR